MKRWQIFVLGLVLAGATFAQPQVPDGWTDGFVMANGIRIHYWRTGGDKPVLILLHGFSDDGLCWVNLAKELEADYDIIMADARGHGLSDPPAKDDPTDAQAEDIAGLIKALKLEKPIVMGHSMGSSSAAWFAAKYPDIPRAVILEDPGLTRRSRKDPSPEQEEKKRLQILQRNNTPYEALVADCLKKNPQWGRSECEWWAPSKRTYHPNNAYRKWGARPSAEELFAKITAPTLILKADAQGEVRAKNEEVATILKKGKIVHVEGAGHCVRRDREEQYLKVLKKFLGEL
ncbi:MAG: alpha/beta hydrolase [Kiritimatiellales bacterium]|nr:alpha/beta hydrolase [Kiritimatiellales bacterium]